MKLNKNEATYETRDENYRMTYDAEAEYVHEDAVMYYPDGSGYPGCDELEIESIKTYDYQIYNPVYDEFEPFTPMPEQISSWEEEIEEFLKNADMDEWDNRGDDYDEN